MPGWLQTVGWVLLCIFVPVFWGVVVNSLFDLLTGRRGDRRDLTPPEYHI